MCNVHISGAAEAAAPHENKVSGSFVCDIYRRKKNNKGMNEKKFNAIFRLLLELVHFMLN